MSRDIRDIKNYAEPVLVGGVLASYVPASPEAVATVLAAPVSDEEYSRSEWIWLTLSNGDLILGVFPQGDLYCEMENRP